MNIKRAIISVSDKTGLTQFAKFLFDNGVEILSTGGTAEFLENNGIGVTKITEYTGFPEILDGRVKTLHPKLFGGILAKFGDQNHENDLEKNDINRIDLVVVNLNPFWEVARKTTKENELLNHVDIGGVALLRAAAKNYRDVVPVTDPEDYSEIIESIEDCGDIPLHFRRKMALKAFYTTSKYDSNIHKIFSELFASEKYDHEFFEIIGMLRYGSNPLTDATLMKFAGEDSIFDNVINLTRHKSPTYRIVKDVSVIFNVVSSTEKEMVAFAKKGIFVFGITEPDEKDSEYILDNIEKMRGGILYSDNPELILKLRKSKLDGIVTSENIDPEEILTFRPMVFKIDRKIIKKDSELIVDRDLVVKQDIKDIFIDVEETEKIGFEIAKIHKSDTAVYINDRVIISGVQSALNREIAVGIIDAISSDLDQKIEGGTFIFDSPINSDKVIEYLIGKNISKVIIPPALPVDSKYIDILKNNNINVIITSRRYHRY